MTGPSSDTDIATIRKNAREQIRVALRTFKGYRNVDLRVYVDNAEETLPTSKGISIRPALLRPVIEALAKAERTARDEGLLEIEEMASL
jgi:hypothetical protein